MQYFAVSIMIWHTTNGFLTHLAMLITANDAQNAHLQAILYVAKKYPPDYHYDIIIAREERSNVEE